MSLVLHILSRNEKVRKKGGFMKRRCYRVLSLFLAVMLCWSEGGFFASAAGAKPVYAKASFNRSFVAQNVEDEDAESQNLLDMNELEGFAAVQGEGLLTTTGGKGGEVVIVENTTDFVNAIKDDMPRIVVVKGQIVSMLSNDTMNLEIATNLENKMGIKSKGGYGLSVGSNKTIVGYDENAELYGGLKINNGSNVIVSNLNIHGVWPYTGPGDTLEVADSHHVWLNHLSIWNSKDGNLDIKTGADYITVSWCKFWYEDVVCEWDTTDGTQNNREYKKGDTALAKNHGHRLSCLIGSGAGDHDDTDMDKLHVTYHHNWFADFVGERMPRVMYGRAHVYNNYYTCSGNLYCIGVDSYASVLIENNYFKNVRNPHQFAYPENQKLGAAIVERGNSYDNVIGMKDSGQKNDKEIFFFNNAAYDYHRNTAEQVPALISKYAGNQGETLSDSEIGAIVEGVDEAVKADTSKTLPTIAPANLASNDKKMISYDSNSRTYTYQGQNTDGSNGFYTISNPFAGKDFTEELVLKDGYPSWTKGVTIAYWVKLPADSGSVSDAAVLNFNLENDRSLYNRDGVHYKRCVNYSPSNSAYSMGEMKKYVDEEGRVFTVLENYGSLVRYNPSYPVAGYYYTTDEGGAYRVYEQGTDPAVASNWTYLDYIGRGYYADYAYLYDEDPVYGAYSKHREALVSGSFSLYASGSMGYRQDSSDDNTLQRNPNLATYGNYMSMHKMNQFYYWANGSAKSNNKSSLKSPSMTDTSSNWHYVVTVITNDWVQTYIDGTELTTEYLNYWGVSFRLQNSAEGFNLGYRHRGFYQKAPSMDFEGDATILEFISDEDTSLCIGGLGAGAAYLSQNTIQTPAGTQIKELAFYDVPLNASQISATGVTLPTGYQEAALKEEGDAREKYAVIPDSELEPSISGGQQPDTMVAVMDITDITTKMTAGETITLAGTVEPENATNKTIVWSIKDEGSTGATISENKLTAKTDGIVVVTATIEKGTSATAAYTQDFTIEVETAFKLGDVNNDGIIDTKDALCILKYIAGLIDLDESAKERADVDGQPGIGTKDALCILKYVVGIFDGFEPEDFQRAWEKQMEQKFGVPKEWLYGMGVEWYHRTDTPPKSYMVDKPIRSDLQGDMQCWAYSVAMILRYLGEDITGEEFFQEFPWKNEDNGAYAVPLADYLKRRAGYKAHFYMGDQMDLKDAVSKHGLVMVLVQLNREKNIWHYMDISGYDEKYYYICDPLSTLAISDRYNKVFYPEELEEQWQTIYPEYSYLFYVIEKES